MDKPKTYINIRGATEIVGDLNPLIKSPKACYKMPLHIFLHTLHLAGLQFYEKNIFPKS